jgi:hypothetical protein
MLLADTARRLRAAATEPSMIVYVLASVGGATADELPSMIQTADLIARKEIVPEAPVAPVVRTESATFGSIATRWTSGELAREYPDHVRAKDSARDDLSRLRTHVLPHVGDVLVAEFSLDHAFAVMSKIPRERSGATRRHVAQLLHKILSFAVFPLRLIAAHPLPKGFLPRIGKPKPQGFVYPGEDARLCAAVEAVPLPWRLFYGFLHREGRRSGDEAKGLPWRAFDLLNGTALNDINKTGDGRTVALLPATTRALASVEGVSPAHGWRARRGRRGARVRQQARQPDQREPPGAAIP